ncbi:MFS transporter [Rathayibacter sp. KR2-224]|uniref:MFS transporter n=1 Tax=Rathayibacter sp. KR2-224 TaxID=3400913 RepID=UPI003C07A0AB
MTSHVSPATAPVPLPVARRRLTLPTGAAFVGTALAAVGLYLASGAPTPMLLLLEQEWGFPSWALTLAFAVYSFGLIAALLVTGKLSDHLGRRPVLIGALALQAVAMAGLVVAPSIGWVIVARTLQGVATGAATSAFTASIVELAPEHRKRLGSVIAGAVPPGGLALGALFAGFATQLGAAANAIVFAALTVASILGLAIAALSPETSTRQSGALRSLVPRIALPPAVRGEFAAAVAGIAATWTLGALFLGLGPTIVLRVFHIDSGAVDGVAAFAAPGSAALVGLVLGRVAARRVLIVACVAVLAGAAVTVTSVYAGSLPLFIVGGVLGGAGFGAALSGSLRVLGALAQPHERAGVFAAVYTVAYLAFGVPAVVGGFLIAPLGLTSTVVVYGVVVLLAGAVGLVAQQRRAVGERRAVTAASTLCPDCPAAV